MASDFTLEPYQERAVQGMIANGNTFLAFELGLGKTLTVLEYLRRTNQKALIVAPLLVAQRTWPAEIRKWDAFKDFDCVVLHGKDKDLLMKSTARVKIINFDGLKWLKENLIENGRSDLNERVLVIDESTCIKSGQKLNLRFKILKAIQPMFTGVFCLSGTPMPNGHINLWSQYWMLDRGAALGTSFGKFRERFFFESGSPKWICEIKKGAAEEIQNLISPLTSVLRAADHIKMPDSIQREVEVELPVGTRKLYTKLQKDYVWDSGDQKWAVDTAGVLVNKLRQLTQGGMYREEGGYDKLHEGKLDALQSLVESAEGDPIVCAINFKFELDMIRKRLGDVPCISGGMTLREKNSILDAFNRKEIPLLLCHPASLSHGVNDLQHSSNVIVWYSLPWSLEQYQQLNGRLVRRGQKRTVVIFHIIAKDTIDTRISSVLYDKDATQEKFKLAMLNGAREV